MSRLDDRTIFTAYRPTWGPEVVTARDILNTMANTTLTRLVGIMFEKRYLTPDEFLDVVRTWSHDYSVVDPDE